MEQDLMQKLMKSKAIMDIHNNMNRVTDSNIINSNNPTIENAVEALKILQDYKTTRRGELKKQGLGEGARIDTILAYEANRRAESDGRGIVFPAWHQLTQEEKLAYGLLFAAGLACVWCHYNKRY